MAARPDSQAFLLELAWLLATNDEVHDPGEAVRLGESANRLAKGTNPAVLDVLAAAYAADGRVDLAARTAQLALQRALAAKNDTLAAEIRQRLTQYQEAARGDVESPDADPDPRSLIPDEPRFPLELGYGSNHRFGGCGAVDRRHARREPPCAVEPRSRVAARRPALR